MVIKKAKKMLEEIRKEIVNKPENIVASVYLQLNAFLASCLKIYLKKKSTVKGTEVDQSYFLYEH